MENICCTEEESNADLENMINFFFFWWTIPLHSKGRIYRVAICAIKLRKMRCKKLHTIILKPFRAGLGRWTLHGGTLIHFYVMLSWSTS